MKVQIGSTVNLLDTQIGLVDAGEGMAVIPSFGLLACRDRAVVASVAAQAPWLTGKAIPNTSLVERISADEEGSDLRAKIREKVTISQAKAKQ